MIYCLLVKTYEFDSDSSLVAWGEKLAKHLRGGEVIELVGDVGAGKTTLTKGIASGLGIAGPVQSPTFTISNRYSSPNGFDLAHYDFYRLSDAGIMNDELHETVNDPGVVTVLEWGDVVKGVLPKDRLTITFEILSETARRLTLSAHGKKSDKLLGEVA